MAKQIIVLQRQPGAGVTLRVLWWFPVTTGREGLYAQVGAKSEWVGASGAENAAIAAGQVVERGEDLDAPAGTTITSAKALLVTLYANRLTIFTDESDKAAQFYGTFYDGTTWTNANL